MSLCCQSEAVGPMKSDGGLDFGHARLIVRSAEYRLNVEVGQIDLLSISPASKAPGVLCQIKVYGK